MAHLVLLGAGEDVSCRRFLCGTSPSLLLLLSLSDPSGDSICDTQPLPQAHVIHVHTQPDTDRVNITTSTFLIAPSWKRVLNPFIHTACRGVVVGMGGQGTCSCCFRFFCVWLVLDVFWLALGVAADDLAPASDACMRKQAFILQGSTL